MPRTMARTRRALAAYDATQGLRDEMWRAADTDGLVRSCQKADEEAINRVREAFALDTAHVNSRERAMIADIEFMRRCCVPPIRISAERLNTLLAEVHGRPGHEWEGTSMTADELRSIRHAFGAAPSGNVTMYSTLCALAGVGNNAGAIEWLDRGDDSGWVWTTDLKRRAILLLRLQAEREPGRDTEGRIREVLLDDDDNDAFVTLALAKANGEDVS